MSLILTKLFAPQPRRTMLVRPTLLARLSAGQKHKHRLTIIVAPAGFGKTSLATGWLQQRAHAPPHQEEAGHAPPAAPEGCATRSAWLTLDATDSDPAVFTRYLIAALETVHPEILSSIATLVASDQPAQLADVCIALINIFASLPANEPPTLLVLDDYHTIAASAIHQALGFLVEHLPPQLHLLLLSREDPPLPLARLRASSALTELRAGDLHFTPAETLAFLRTMAQLPVSDEQAALLYARTEGWPAGLQLAALSLQGSADLGTSLAAFAGDNRLVLDYLLTDVVALQPEPVRSFWLATAVLGRMCADLCAHVVAAGPWPAPDAGQAVGEAQTMLEYLERRGLFLVPLDARCQWYRYHQLFADLLYSRLVHEAPSAVAALHQAASAWFAAHDLVGEAIHHALAARDWPAAANLIATAAPAWLARNEVQVLCAYAERLPTDLIRQHPALGLAYARALISNGRLAPAASVLDALAHQPLDATQLLALRATQIVIAGAQGNSATVAALAATLLPWLSAEDYVTRGMIAFSTALAANLHGDVAGGIPACEQASELLAAAGNDTVAMVALQSLATMQIMAGDLRAAEVACSRALALGALPSGELLSAACPALIVLSGLHYEWNALHIAERLAWHTVDLSRRWGHEGLQAQALAVLAQARFALGADSEAADLLAQANRLAEGRIEQLSVLRVAVVWAALRGSVDVSIPQRVSLALNAGADEELQLILAREQLAAGQAALVIPQLEGLRAVAVTAGRIGRAIEAAALEALAWQAVGDTHRAIAALEQALGLAAPRSYLRLFRDMGQPFVNLGVVALARWADSHLCRAYLRQLLAPWVSDQQGAARPRSPAGAPQPLVESLSAREIEVLRLLAAGLSNSAIAEQLILAPGTVKRHLHTIYGKLGVEDRLQAASCARDLGLI